METKREKFTISKYLNNKQLNRTKITKIPNENKINLSIHNHSKNDLNTEVYEQIIQIITILISHNLKFSISHQYKTDKKGIHHVDITYEDNNN